MKDYFLLLAFPHFSVHEEDQVIFKWYGINEKLVGVFYNGGFRRLPTRATDQYWHH